MASLAGLLRERGHALTGSDQDVYPPMSTQLEALGLQVRSPYAEANVPEDADLVVIGNALSRGNPEVEVVLDRKQPMTSLPALVGEEFLRGRTSLVVAGTHGKTTTTSLLAFLLEQGAKDPSFLVGGVPVDFDRSYRLGGGPHFVVEGDEYDSAFFDKRPKFVHYRPDVAVIGNVELDHADIYPDLAAVQTAFLRLMSVIPRRGLLVAGIESPALRELLPRAYCPVETFGLAEGADWRALDLRRDGRGTTFKLRVRGRDEGDFAFGLLGEHNVRNALAALAAGLVPIVCVGELLEERKAGRTKEVIREQFEGSLAGLTNEQMAIVVIAYEPVWAIGTGQVATPAQAEEVHLDLRKIIAARYNAPIAEVVRIQYGGSVKPDNVDELMSQPDIDGALVGGAALKADSFLRIIHFR
jgi:UDP-N-acetylmuramate: L-alanyl-gamma-D-glutamyl-meso-diaminopimelate ligase